jgi:hypothetical protein
MKRLFFVIFAALLVWTALAIIIKVDHLNAEYERNIREHPPAAPAPVIH